MNSKFKLSASHNNFGSTKHSQGVALVVSLLMVVVLLGVLMAVTSTLSLASRRITSDQSATQQTQFAAESGLALARARLKETYTLLNSMSIPQSVTDATLETAIQNFCDGAALTPSTGPATCTSSLNVTGMNKFSLFTTYITSGYPTGVTASAYWQDVFYDAGGSTPKQVQKVISTAGGASTRYTLTGYGLIPVDAKRLAPSLYQINFTLAAPQLKGEMMVGSNAVSTRKIQLSMPSPSPTFTLTISRPSYAQYVLFRNQTTNPSGSQLYFLNGETFNGPVHTNGTPGFSGTPGPTFTDKFTSAASSPTGTSATFTTTAPQYGQTVIPLPSNSNNQIRASYGGNASDMTAITATELPNAWGVPSMASGVYFSQGNGTTPNTGSSWKGGLYVNGNVNSMTLSKSGNYQVITIVQGATTTVFAQQSNGTWTVTVNNVLVKTLSASPAFNGMIYVAGGVTSLSGDGTGVADIASGSQITLSTTGTVNITNDITYTDNPTTNSSATNVLGIYSSGGNVLLNGPMNQSLNVNASIMASGSGNGFGTVNVASSRGTPAPNINLLGGVIEDQSQQVSTFTTNSSGNLVVTGGYGRNYSYDPRFRLGFAPPFFPLQQQWSDSVADFTQQKGVWEPKGN